MIDKFSSYASSLESPAERHFPITPDDGANLPTRPRSIRIGAAGTIAVRDIDGMDATYSVTSGEVLPIRCVRVLSAGTTAGNIVGWS